MSRNIALALVAGMALGICCHETVHVPGDCLVDEVHSGAVAAANQSMGVRVQASAQSMRLVLSHTAHA